MTVARGRLIVFEGPEGAGKTTQLRRLGAWLAHHGVAHVSVREPGGTALGDEIRALLLDPAREIAPRAELHLFLASRAELMEEVVDPALAAGAVVLVDRFFLSTYAYQVEGRGLPEADVRAANAAATGGRVPDLTLLFRVPAAVRHARAARRGSPDRIERAGADFHERVERAFARYVQVEWQRAHPECGPIVQLDGEGGEDEVFSNVLLALARHLPDPFAAASATGSTASSSALS